MAKVTVVDGLNDKSASEKVSYGTLIEKKGTANSNFPLNAPFILAIHDATGALKTANGTKDASVIHTAEETFDLSVQSYVLHVQGVILGIDPLLAIEKVESTGLGVKKKGSKHIKDIKVEKDPLVENGVIVKVKAVSKLDGKAVRVAYVWFRKSNIEGDTEMKFLKTSTFATIHDANLKPDTKYWYQCAIVIGEEQGEFSLPVPITM